MSINFQPEHVYFEEETKTLLPGLVDTRIKNCYRDGSFLGIDQTSIGRDEIDEDDMVVLDWETQKALYLILRDRFGAI